MSKAAAAAAEAAAIDQSTSNGRRAGSVLADSLCVCSRPPRSIFLRFRRMHESAVHTTTAETACNGRLTVQGSCPIQFLRTNSCNVYTCMEIFPSCGV